MSTPAPSDAALRSDNARMVGKLLVVAALMFAFGYALVPIYRSICNALGINVLSLSERAVPGNSADKRNTQVDLTRTISVEFDANARGVWDFKPAQRRLDVHPGEVATVMYEFTNTQSRTMAAQAIPSYAPKQASPHFKGGFGMHPILCFLDNTNEALAGSCAPDAPGRIRPPTTSRSWTRRWASCA